MNTILKIILLTFTSLALANNGPNRAVSFCAGGWEEDYSYYNLFVQESIDEPQYEPFLLSYNSAYYSRKRGTEDFDDNENIADWQRYLDISYDNAGIWYLPLRAKLSKPWPKGNLSPIKNWPLLMPLL
ncbi:hypothetical protein [Sinomicrobium sp. M5D2P9]